MYQYRRYIYAIIPAMSVKTILGFGVAAATAYYIYNTKRFVKSTRFTFDKLDFNFSKKQIFITLGALNPTNATINIKSIVGALIVNNKEVATISNFGNRKVLPNVKTQIRLTLAPSASGVISVLINFVKSKLKGANKTTAFFEGSANVNGVNMPVKTKLL